MIKSIVALLAAGACAWGAGRAPGPPVMPEDYRIVRAAQAGWQPPRITLELAGCQLNSQGLAEGSVRVYLVNAEGATEPLPRKDYRFKGTSGSVYFSLPMRARRVVVRVEDLRGQREARTLILQ